MNSLTRLLTPLLAAGTLGLCIACTEGGSYPEVGSTSPATTLGSTGETKAEGSLSFALTTPGNLKFDKFDLVIVGPNFSRAKSIDVSNSSTVSALIDTIPAGTGYSLTLSGTSLAPDTVVCSGSAAFAITAGNVSSVPVAVQCKELTSAPVPLPPFTPIALSLLLLGVGIAAMRRIELA